jgi:hypothetical protein
MSGERPSHKCFVVEDREGAGGKEAFWTRIGSAWPHKDGKGFNLQLSALPAGGGRMVMREIADDEAREEEQPSGGADAETRLSELTRVARAGPDEPHLQLAEQVLRDGVREIASAMRSKRRKDSGAA